MMTPVPLEQAADERVFGGKSAQLGASLRAGLPVPPGWALSVDVVEAVVRERPEAIRSLGELLAHHPHPMAVRSSGVGEDDVLASFAGQHITELNRVGIEDVCGAIRAVWDSGRSESARSYRAKLGVVGEPRIAVTLQVMVSPDCAGVMFTRHPITGADEILIEAAWGLGEAVVEGLVIPDRFRLRRDGTLVEKKAGVKDLLIRALPGGGTEETPIEDPEKINGFCLRDAQLPALLDLANRCEAHFGPGRDIEWGYAENTLYLLQCRSITTRTGP